MNVSNTKKRIQTLLVEKFCCILSKFVKFINMFYCLGKQLNIRDITSGPFAVGESLKNIIYFLTVSKSLDMVLITPIHINLS